MPSGPSPEHRLLALLLLPINLRQQHFLPTLGAVDVAAPQLGRQVESMSSTTRWGESMASTLIQGARRQSAQPSRMLTRQQESSLIIVKTAMQTTRRELLTLPATARLAAAAAAQGPLRYVRFRRGRSVTYGILQEDSVRELRGLLFANPQPTGAVYKLSEVKLLYPCQPRKILAVALNYKSHLGNRQPPTRPELFWKPVSALQNPGDPIVIPADAKNVHYEGELVLVMGRRLRNASPEQARQAIFGVTCGNDVSERDWQQGDVQWWRAKGADTFAPMGPAIVCGLDYSKLRLRTRLNGEVVQEQSTGDLLFDGPAIVSFASRYVTLEPGDVIFTGTPGATRPVKPGDVVEVEIEGIGVLRNPVTAG